MTRLYYEIIKDIPVSLTELDDALRQATGLDLRGLACRAAGLPVKDVLTRLEAHRAAVVPVSSGDGVIPGFSEAVASILCHIGLTASVTARTDVAGIGEAVSTGADIVFAADDCKFLALNLNTKSVIDNSEATAAGFAHALAAAAEYNKRNITGLKVLVLGLGPVGTHAVSVLRGLGCEVFVHDINPDKLKSFTGNSGVRATPDLSIALAETDFILDATPAASIINETMIHPGKVISCPGVPHGLTPAALAVIGNGFIHDNLPLGVATMGVQGIFK